MFLGLGNVEVCKIRQSGLRSDLQESEEAVKRVRAENPQHEYMIKGENVMGSKDKM